MLKVGERKSIFDIANVIGNIRLDLTTPQVEEVTVQEEVKEIESEGKKIKIEKNSRKVGTI